MKSPIALFADTKWGSGRPIRILGSISFSLVLLGILVVLLFGTSLSGKATCLIWILACLLAGASIGFLFGIPKIIQANATTGGTVPIEKTYQQQVNTNLTEISDWLTKIIVGLGLVNLTKIPPYLEKIAKILGSALNDNCPAGCPMAIALAYGIIISYFILGFLYGYITTRLYLAGAFAQADQLAQLTVTQEKADNAAGAAESALQQVNFAVTTPIQRRPTQESTPEKELANLAKTYVETRRLMDSGDLRTRKMAEIFKTMVTVADDAADLNTDNYLQNTDIGLRLVGYAILYAKPNYDSISNLVDAFITDTTPFGQYWGIMTLRKTMESFPNNNIDTTNYEKIKKYYNGLKKGIDREFELSRIFPEFKKQNQ